MAHFAKIGINNLVEDIVFVDNTVTANVYLDADDGDKEKSDNSKENLTKTNNDKSKQNHLKIGTQGSRSLKSFIQASKSRKTILKFLFSR